MFDCERRGFVRLGNHHHHLCHKYYLGVLAVNLPGGSRVVAYMASQSDSDLFNHLSVLMPLASRNTRYGFGMVVEFR